MWAEFRQQMPIAHEWAYFDHAAVSPLPLPTVLAMKDWIDQSATAGTSVWGDWYKALDEGRRWIAPLIGASPNELAFIHNTTHGISLVADGWDWQAGDNVITLADEFPSNQYAWSMLERDGVEVRCVQLGEDDDVIEMILRACDGRTRLAAVSWVSYSHGRRLNLTRLADGLHERGALLFVDAIQGMGVFPLNVQQAPIDFLAADGHKWMLGPEGAGLFYVRGEHLDRLRPIGVGWHSVSHAFDYSRVELALRPDARRFEGGSHNMIGLHGLRASLKLLNQCGWDAADDRLAQRVLDLGAALRAKLAELPTTVAGPTERDSQSGIVSFALEGVDPARVRRQCFEQRVAVSCRDGRLRAAVHAYNNEDDLDRLLAVLRAAVP